MKISPVLNFKNNYPSSTNNDSKVSFGNYSGLYANKTNGELFAIVNLRRRGQGAYILTDAFYLLDTIDRLPRTILEKATEIIFKNPIQKGCCIGMTPSRILKLLETTNATKAIAIVDDGLHSVKLPKRRQFRDRIHRDFKKSQALDNEKNIMSQDSANLAQFLYDESVKMLCNPFAHDIEIRREYFD